MEPLPRCKLTSAQKDLIGTLANCKPGKGMIIPNPSTDVESTFRSCQDRGWAEEVTLDSIRIWKATSEGRFTLRGRDAPFLYLIQAGLR